MIPLGQLIGAIPAPVDARVSDLPVLGVTCDSREVRPGYVFVALRGEKADGHRFVRDAVARGCLAAVGEEVPEGEIGAPFIRVSDTHQAYGRMAAAFHGSPGDQMTLVGLTGTNGKTTTSWILEQVIMEAGGRPGVIGTVNYHFRDDRGAEVTCDAPLTTPEPMQLNGLLKRMHGAGVTHVILEVSSHSLEQKRVEGLRFDVAVFTNLSRDHLDYHGDMDRYFAAKRNLFERYLKPGGTAVVCSSGMGTEHRVDWGNKLITRLNTLWSASGSRAEKAGTILSCGSGKNCDLTAVKVVENIDGQGFLLRYAGGEVSIRSGLIGGHNRNNLLTAAGAGLALGWNLPSVAQGLQRVQSVPGRLERVPGPVMPPGKKASPGVFVDYAHTPDALENVLHTLRPLTRGRLICVFGCGGDRDRGKRPMMAAAAAAADVLIITSDNPRSEDPAAILAEVVEGLESCDLPEKELDDLFAGEGPEKGYVLLEDRRQAIHHACSRALPEDVVLIAGKGHETYQLTASGRHYFDDRVEALNGMLCWNVDHLLAATSGSLLVRGQTALFGNISTDTRSLRPGDVYVALAGERFDGHDFLDSAIEKGAAALIVSREPEKSTEKTTCILVDDPETALGNLAGYRRRLLTGRVKVIGITGSSGKTTVKEMTALVVEKAFEKHPGKPVLKTLGNLNNLIGLPLSLLKLDGSHQVAVMEMGMNVPGEIRKLTRIAEPDVGCITNVQPAHLQGLGSVAGVARAKGELFAEMGGQGIRVVNCDDPQTWKLGGKYGDNSVGFAVTPRGRRRNPTVRATRLVNSGEKGMRFTLHIGSWRKRISIPAVGEHNVANCAATAAIATAAGIAPDDIVKGLGEYVSGDRRLQIIELPGEIKVVNDSYNANPASMAAALRTVAEFGGQCRRVALLGDMFELGSGAPEEHARVGKIVAGCKYDYLGVTGEFAATVAEMAVKSGMQSGSVRTCPDRESMACWVATLVAEKRIGRGDWLLVKGSRGMRMETVVQTLDKKLAAGES